VVSFAGVRILIDTGPELRLQCLTHHVERIDAVVFTHAHADHVVGLDDLRRFSDLTGTAIPCYGTAATIAKLRRMFDYIFDDDADYPSTKPRLDLIEIDERPFEIAGHAIRPVPLMHGTMPVMGFRFGGIAYCTDCSMIPDESRRLLAGLDVLILDGLRRRPHPTHFHLARAVEEARRIGARQTYFTHLAHELAQATTDAELPAGMGLAYDGLVVRVPARPVV
jgi:phosphoribosyl 1,2-cyclic phosphate phosphodiesterase